jgi:hypothetical protein
LNCYSVFDRYGKKIADCGWERDAILLVEMDPTRTYRQVKYVNPQTVDVPHVRMTDDFQLRAQQILPQSELEPFIV